MKYIAKGFVITDTKIFETFWTKEIFVFNALLWKNGYRTFQPSRRLQQVMSYNRIHDSSVWGHTGESEFESNSAFERQRYFIWERFKIPEWLPFRELKLIFKNIFFLVCGIFFLTWGSIDGNKNDSYERLEIMCLNIITLLFSKINL
jgi:hypothetical protein